MARAPDTGGPAPLDDDLAALAVRHRIAIETLRDVEADRRAGTLDDEAYRALRDEAEARATQTLAELENASTQRESALPVAQSAGASPETQSAGASSEASAEASGVGGSSAARWPSSSSPRRWAVVLGAALVVLLAIGALAPPPLSLGNATVVNQELAAQQATEQERQVQIQSLLAQLRSNPNDPPTLVRLANLYLAGGTPQDTVTAANVLLAAIKLDAHNAEAYRLLITAYISAADYRDATAATDAFAKLGAPVAADVAFFRGLIAYRGSGDRTTAIRWFDAFLKAAPNDPRATMIRSLRAEAAGQLSGSSPSTAP
jgi:cytochrome c-type biogenesis protein CcmH/NrfG